MKTYAAINLIVVLISLVCWIMFSSDDMVTSLGWGTIGTLSALMFSVSAITKNASTKGRLRTICIASVVWVSLSLVLIFITASNTNASAVLSLLTLLTSIPFSIYYIIAAKKSCVESTKNSNIQKINLLHELLNAGAINEEEFKKFKSKLMD